MNGIILFTKIMSLLIGIFCSIKSIAFMRGEHYFNFTHLGKLRRMQCELQGITLTFPWPKYGAIAIACFVWFLCV